MKPLLLAAVLSITLSGCEAFFPSKGRSTVRTTVTRYAPSASAGLESAGSSSVMETIVTEQPYVSPQEQAHAEATKSLFSE